MIPIFNQFFNERNCIPRVSGGDPYGYLNRDDENLYSPRKRGVILDLAEELALEYSPRKRGVILLFSFPILIEVRAAAKGLR